MAEKFSYTTTGTAVYLKMKIKLLIITNQNIAEASLFLMELNNRLRLG